MKSCIKRVAGVILGIALVLGFVSCPNEPETKIEYVEKTYCSPVIFSAEDLGDDGVRVTMETATEGAVIHYTTNGSTPTESSPVYTAPVTFINDVILKAIVIKYGIENSPVSVATVSIVGKTIEVEKLVYTSELAAGTYTVYHFQQKTTGGKAVSDYELESTDSNKSVAAKSTIANLKKTYEGFTEKAMAQNETAIYIFYDRNTITYSFQTGTEGKFADGTTSKEVSGLYGASYSKPRAPTSGDYNFVKWQDSSGTAAPSKFGAKDKKWTAVWRAKSEGLYSACVVGDFILKDGTVLSKDETPENGTVAAVIVRAAADDKPALGVGIVHGSSLSWCTSSAAGYNINITALQEDDLSDYIDGSDSWDLLVAACDDLKNATAETIETVAQNYPAFNYCRKYGTENSLPGELENGWYLPTVAELYTIYQNKTTVDTSLSKAGGDQFGTSAYWSCCLDPSLSYTAWRLSFYDSGVGRYNKKGNFPYVCSVRAFN